MWLCLASGIFFPSEIVSKILQRGAHGAVIAEGRADPPCRPDRGSDVDRANIGRVAPPIYSSVSFRQGQPVTGEWISDLCDHHHQVNREPVSTSWAISHWQS